MCDDDDGCDGVECYYYTYSDETRFVYLVAGRGSYAYRMHVQNNGDS
jgi:hypothetical protein